MSEAVRVVIIDDDPDLRNLIKLTLEFTAGWEVTSAEDGSSGIDAVRSTQPHAVVVDLMMPNMDGYEVCRRLKKDPETRNIPVVMLTARKHLDQRQLSESGAAGVVFKPFEPDELASRVRALMQEAQGA